METQVKVKIVQTETTAGQIKRGRTIVMFSATGDSASFGHWRGERHLNGRDFPP